MTEKACHNVALGSFNVNNWSCENLDEVLEIMGELQVDVMGLQETRHWQIDAENVTSALRERGMLQVGTSMAANDPGGESGLCVSVFWVRDAM